MKQNRKQSRNLAWHFTGPTLRDGSPVPADGIWLEHHGPLVHCKSGLHWSRQPFDALRYAPGATLCLVEIGGAIIEEKGDDNGISSRRRIIARMDAADLLRYFARMQALSVIHLNNNLPEVVADYLMTGNEDSRSAAWSAARSAAWSAAESAAERAARSAARSAAEYAAESAESAARSAAWNAAESAAESAESAARSAARSAAERAASDHFNDLVRECFERVL